MMPFNPPPEPPDFDKKVRQPGNAWLVKNPNPKKVTRDYWSPFKSDLADGFNNLCGYSVMYEPVGTVDHYRSRENYRNLAYEWSNLRFASAWINSSKGTLDDQVLDPFDLGEDWFEILLPSLQLVLTDKVPPQRQYWESVLRPQAKERQRESARRLNQSKCSNLNHSINESKSQLKKGKPVIREVSENLNISVGSYHKGKKVFELISQLREMEKFKAVVALEMEFNRSIDAAYKFVCNQDICYQVIDLLEADEIGSIGDGIAWMRNGDVCDGLRLRNPFRRFQLDQVYHGLSIRY